MIVAWRFVVVVDGHLREFTYSGSCDWNIFDSSFIFGKFLMLLSDLLKFIDCSIAKKTFKFHFITECVISIYRSMQQC